MGNRLDQLFKNKLEKRVEIPSAEAWSQIHGQLKTGRRKLWMKRIAVAASLLLIAMAGMWMFDVQKPKSTSISMHEPLTVPQEPTANEALATPIEKTEQEKIVANETVIGVAERQPMVTKKVIHKKDKEVIVTEKSDVEVPANKIENPTDSTNFMENERIQNAIETPLLTDNIEVYTLPDTVSVKKKRKIKIIYKASENSTLVASGKKNILEKGLDELSEFSNEHLLTENRKAKLSQTKDDLMALNFGKAFTNSNEDK